MCGMQLAVLAEVSMMAVLTGGCRRQRGGKPETQMLAHLDELQALTVAGQHDAHVEGARQRQPPIHVGHCRAPGLELSTGRSF